MIWARRLNSILCLKTEIRREMRRFPNYTYKWGKELESVISMTILYWKISSLSLLLAKLRNSQNVRELIVKLKGYYYYPKGGNTDPPSWLALSSRKSRDKTLLWLRDRRKNWKTKSSSSMKKDSVNNSL